MIAFYIAAGLITFGLIGLVVAISSGSGGGPILLGETAGGIRISQAVIALGIVVGAVALFLHAVP